MRNRNDPVTRTGHAPRRKLFVKSFGCQMNVYDSARMVDLLAPEGYDETARLEEADLVILNTCHIRERASEKVFSELGKLRALKRERARAGLGTVIAVAGCVAQAEGQEIIRRQSAVDLVVGPQSYHRLPKLLRRARSAPGIVDTDFPVDDKFDHLVEPTIERTRSRGLAAFVTVQEGCDKFCTFCVVPYTRGAELSRSPRKVIAEVELLARAGVREVTLLGQNVNAYHGIDESGEAWTLAGLIKGVAGVPGILRVRYTTSHPRDMDETLFGAHGKIPALMPFLHLPVQSGSDRILDAMNRGHTVTDYLDIVSRAKSARPDIVISSDFIVGFPGETEEDFAATLDLIRTVRFASAYFFKYSARPGTPGAEMPAQISESVKDERLARLKSLVETQRDELNRAMIGRTVDVLFEKKGRYPGQIAGKSPYLQAVQVDAPEALIGEILPVTIVEAAPNSLFGRISQPLVQPNARTEYKGGAD